MAKKLGKKRRFSLPPRFVNLEENRDVSFKVGKLSAESRSKILGRNESDYCKDAHTKVVRKKANESNHSTLKESLKVGIAGATACISAFAAFHVFHSSFISKTQTLTDEIQDVSLEKSASEALKKEIAQLSKLKFEHFSQREARVSHHKNKPVIQKVVVKKLQAKSEPVVTKIEAIESTETRSADRRLGSGARKPTIRPAVQSTDSVHLERIARIGDASLLRAKPIQVPSTKKVKVAGVTPQQGKKAIAPTPRKKAEIVSTQPPKPLTVAERHVEAKKMRNLYRTMRHRFYLAVNTQAEDRIMIAKRAPIRASKDEHSRPTVKKVTTQKPEKARPTVSTQVAKVKEPNPRVIRDDFQINWTKPRDQKIVVSKIGSHAPKNLKIPKPSSKVSTHIKPPSGLFAATANQMWKSMNTQKSGSQARMKVDRTKKTIEILPTKSVDPNLSTQQASTKTVKPKISITMKSVDPLPPLSTHNNGKALSSIFIEGQGVKRPEYPKVSIQKLPPRPARIDPIEQYAENAVGPQNRNEYPYIEYSPQPEPVKRSQPVEITKIDPEPEPLLAQVEPTIEEPVEVARVMPEEPLLPVEDLPLPDVPTTDIVEVSESETAKLAEYSKEKKTVDETPDLQAWFQPGYRYAEAFNSAHTLTRVEHEKVSSERVPAAQNSTESVNLETNGGAWVVTSADRHVPTLAWHPQTATREEVTIPLISENSKLILGASMKTKIQREAGMVYGHLPKGWAFDTSFSPKDMLLFDVDGKRLDNDDPQARYDARTFVIANVNPGAHLIFLNELRNAKSYEVIRDGSVGFPVIAGKVTYLDLRDVREVRASGTVYSASSEGIGGLENVHVMTLSRGDKGVFTNKVGRFHFQKVTLFGDFPVLVEAQVNGGFRHRYQLSPGKFQNSTLFYFDDKQISEFVQQIGGEPLDEESGMVISALPGISEKLNYEPVFPSLKTLVNQPSFQPETYTLSPDGELLVETALAESSPRFVSVQVPEGPAVARIFDRAGRQAGSWMVYSSPGVVNVLLAD